MRSPNLKKWLSGNKTYLLGALLGAVAGFLYWRLIGCSSGSCAITSNPLNSTLYFSLAGLFIGGNFRKTDNNAGNQESNNIL